MSKFTCKMVKKTASKTMAGPNLKADGDAFGITDNDDSSFSVSGTNKAGAVVDISAVATLAVTSSDPTVLSVETPVGTTCQTHGLKAGSVTLDVTATWLDGSVGPFALSLTGTVSQGPVSGLVAKFSDPVPR